MQPLKAVDIDGDMKNSIMGKAAMKVRADLLALKERDA